MTQDMGLVDGFRIVIDTHFARACYPTAPTYSARVQDGAGNVVARTKKYDSREKAQERGEAARERAWHRLDMAKPLPPGGLEALQAYAAKHGRTWKSKLSLAWSRASEPGVLQQIRNSHGPGWLANFKLPPAAPPSPCMEAAIVARDALIEGRLDDARKLVGEFVMLGGNINGTCLLGEFTTSYLALRTLFGEPNSVGDHYKVSTEWELTFEGKTVTVYDWKETNLYDDHTAPSVEAFRERDSYGWHIGGNDKAVADRFILFLSTLLEGVKLPPAAACPRCGGWTSFGGMSQFAKSTEAVLGRIGCTCNRVAAAPQPSWAPEVLVDGKWSSNNLRFATKVEAERWARDLLNRWFVPTDSRAVESTDAVSHKLTNGGIAEAITNPDDVRQWVATGVIPIGMVK